MSRGTEEQFTEIVSALQVNMKSYEDKKIKHYQWADNVDAIFGSFGWSKQEFYKELNARLGVHTNDSIREAKEAKKVKPKLKVDVKKKSSNVAPSWHRAPPYDD